MPVTYSEIVPRRRCRELGRAADDGQAARSRRSLADVETVRSDRPTHRRRPPRPSSRFVWPRGRRNFGRLSKPAAKILGDGTQKKRRVLAEPDVDYFDDPFSRAAPPAFFPPSRFPSIVERYPPEVASVVQATPPKGAFTAGGESTATAAASRSIYAKGSAPAVQGLVGAGDLLRID